VDEIQVGTAAEAAALRNWLISRAEKGAPVAAIGNLKIGMTKPNIPGSGPRTVQSLTPYSGKALRIMRLGGTRSSSDEKDATAKATNGAPAK
jgi:hypothetical protein